MTRFLSRIWDDPHCGTFNEDTEQLFAYHDATKHTYQSVRRDAHFLDWKNQPNPFRSYEGAPSIKLPPMADFPETGTFATIAAVSSVRAAGAVNPGQDGAIPLGLDWLSRLLWHSMAISAWKKVPGSGSRYSLRVNPSSGNLHPTETYLSLQGFRDIGDGLYHYRADSHALEYRRGASTPLQLAQSLQLSWAAESQLIVGLTSIFWREAWKYRDRAYRYCCHDLGHAMMSLLLAARALGLPGGVVAHFGDARLSRELGLTGGDEAPMAFLVFPQKCASKKSISSREDEFAGIANELSPQEVPYELLLDIHRATILPDSVCPLPDASTNIIGGGERPPGPEPFDIPAAEAPLGQIVRRRRSALDFDPRTHAMERQELEQLVDYATRDWRADWRGNFRGAANSSTQGTDFIALFFYVHRVGGFDPGVYRWNKSARLLEQLHHGNVERVAAYLSLEQPLAGNSCFTISMIADLAKASEAFGNRGYRYVYFEAGAIGQRLYLGAEALNWNATGIGAFYDDDVHRFLGFLEDGDRPVQAPPEVETALGKNSRMLAQQVIYHFAVGRPIPDPRIEG